MTVAVTGASGFIGGNLVGALRDAGIPTVALGRRRVPAVDTRPLALGTDVDPHVFDGVDVLVHCAWDLTAKTSAEVYQRNVVGSIKLFTCAAAAGVRRLVFVSSMSAYAGTKQLYGRSKLETEHLASDLGGLSLRLGLVWGLSPGGMAGAVQRLTRLPIVPMLGARSYQFTVHEDDVNAALRAAIEHPELRGVIGVAAPDPVPTPQLLTGLARLAGIRPGRFVPVPWQLAYAPMRLFEAARIPLPLRADSILGLVRPAPSVPRQEEWLRLGVRFRRFGDDAATNL